MNLYCLFAIVTVPKLRSIDFFLVTVQTIVDFLFVGCVGAVLKVLEVAHRAELSIEAYDDAFLTGSENLQVFFSNLL